MHPLKDLWHQWLAAASERPDLRAPIAVALGAIPGALGRYYLSLLCARLWGTGWPIGTFLVNLSGAVLMGLFVGWMTDRSPLYPELRLLFAVGFLGSYTTFSSYILDASNLARSGAWVMSLAYGFGSFALGWLGLELGRWLIDRWR